MRSGQARARNRHPRPHPGAVSKAQPPTRTARPMQSYGRSLRRLRRRPQTQRLGRRHGRRRAPPRRRYRSTTSSGSTGSSATPRRSCGRSRRSRSCSKINSTRSSAQSSHRGTLQRLQSTPSQQSSKRSAASLSYRPAPSLARRNRSPSCRRVLKRMLPLARHRRSRCMISHLTSPT